MVARAAASLFSHRGRERKVSGGSVGPARGGRPRRRASGTRPPRAAQRVSDRKTRATSVNYVRRSAAGATGAAERCARRCRRDSSDLPSTAARAQVHSCSPVSTPALQAATWLHGRSLEPLGVVGCRCGEAELAAKGLFAGHSQPRVSKPAAPLCARDGSSSSAVVAAGARMLDHELSVL